MKTKIFYILTLVIIFHSCNEIKTQKTLNLANMQASKPTFSIQDTSYVGQGEIGFTNSTSKKYILGTFGANSCVIAAFYNPNTKEAGLSHIDAAPDVADTLNSIKNELIKNGNLIVYLATSRMTNNKTLDEIKKIIDSDSNIELIETLNTTSLGINAKNGQAIRTNSSGRDLDVTDEEFLRKYHERENYIKINNIKEDEPTAPYNLCFDGRKEEFQSKNNKEWIKGMEKETRNYLIRSLNDKSIPNLELSLKEFLENSCTSDQISTIEKYLSENGHPISSSATSSKAVKSLETRSSTIPSVSISQETIDFADTVNTIPGRAAILKLKSSPDLNDKDKKLLDQVFHVSGQPKVNLTAEGINYLKGLLNKEGKSIDGWSEII